LRFKTTTLYVLLLLLLSCGIVFPATTGKISGVVTDKETGDPLPGVAVSVVGTSWGALTDADGKYFILNVPVGEYVVKAELIGYAPVEVQNLSVSNDLTTYVDIQMSSKVVDIGQVQTVIAERPLVILDQTSSVNVVSKSEIDNLPARSYQDIVGLSAGVVPFQENVSTAQRGAPPQSTNPTMYIRGGRQGEVAYFVDGFLQQDPLSNLSTTTINSNAIDQISISTGGFNAEYGWVSSGAINVTTREGGRSYHGAVEVVTDNTPLTSNNTIDHPAVPPGDLGGDYDKPAIANSYDYNTYNINLDGPVFPNNDRLSFFVSGERRWYRDRAPRSYSYGRLPSNSQGGWTWQGKLKFDVNPQHVIRLGILGSRDDWRRYLQSFYFDTDHARRYLDKNQSFYAKWTATMSPKTFFELGGTYYITERTQGDGVFFDDLSRYYVSGNYSRFDQTLLFRPWDDPTTDTLDESYFDPGYLHRKSSYYGATFDITSQINRSNEVKFGTSFEYHTVRRYDPAFIYNVSPSDPDSVKSQNVDYYGYSQDGLSEVNSGPDGAKHPYMFALYLQDKVEWEGLVVNGGVRWDYLNVNTDRLTNPDKPLGDNNVLDASDFTSTDAYTKLSPRLGIGFPVTERTVFHINYGKFFQRPELENVYVGTKYLRRMVAVQPYFDFFGNPNLKPEETIAYEVGLSHQLGDNTAFNLTAYYKDVNDLTVLRRIPLQKFATFRNEDFGTLKGVDFQLKMRRVRGISGELDYTLAYANGTGSAATTDYNIAWQDTEAPLIVSPVDFDQRHKITAIVDVRAGKQQGPKLGEVFPLENAGVNFVFQAGSGTPYTPVDVWNEVTLASGAPRPNGRINSRYSPWTYRLDMKANKTFYVKNLAFDIYFWVLNVFDTKNVTDVYEGTGLPDNTGFLSTSTAANTAAGIDAEQGAGYYEDMYQLRQNDPNNYDMPRQVRVGLRMNF
jgi:outer membrane receptor protein involved in Fe transport